MLECIILVHNFQTELVGLNEIVEVRRTLGGNLIPIRWDNNVEGGGINSND